MIRAMIVILIAAMLMSCTQLKIGTRDPVTGYFPADRKASVVVSKQIVLDQRKALILVSDVAPSVRETDFVVGQVRNIGYFDEVATRIDLEKSVVRNNLGDKVQSVNDRIGIHHAAKHYKPFLWLRHVLTGSGNNRNARLILTDPLTMDDIFVAEVSFTPWSLTDQNVWYPMHNALIDYIKQNSVVFGR